METIQINDKRYKIPTSWNELTPKQAQRVVDFLDIPINKYYINMWLLQHFTRLSFDTLVRIPSDIMTRIHDLTEWAHGDIMLAKHPYPILRIWGKKYIGCGDALSDTTFEQFFQCTEYYFYQYTTTRSTSALNALISCMYCTSGIFNPEQAIKRAHWFSLVSNRKKKLLLAYYIGSRNFLAKRFPKVFTKDNENSKPKTYNDLKFIELLDRLNQGNAANNHILKKVPLFEMLTRISNAISDADKTE